jgi:hypothetical protein
VKKKRIEMKNRNYVMSLYCGDTYLDVYGSIDKAELDIGYVGGVDIEDVFIADTEISVLEMIHSLGWDKFNDKVQSEYTPES